MMSDHIRRQHPRVQPESARFRRCLPRYESLNPNPQPGSVPVLMNSSYLMIGIAYDYRLHNELERWRHVVCWENSTVTISMDNFQKQSVSFQVPSGSLTLRTGKSIYKWWSLLGKIIYVDEPFSSGSVK